MSEISEMQAETLTKTWRARTWCDFYVSCAPQGSVDVQSKPST